MVFKHGASFVNRILLISDIILFIYSFHYIKFYKNLVMTGEGPLVPPVLYLYAPRVNETKIILFALWVFLKYHLEKILIEKKSKKNAYPRHGLFL